MAHVTAVLLADGAGFVSRAVPQLNLTFDGIATDRHVGRLRGADARTPWHQRGTPIADTRHVSILSQEECDEIAALLDVPSVDPALLGANLVVRHPVAELPADCSCYRAPPCS